MTPGHWRTHRRYVEAAVKALTPHSVSVAIADTELCPVNVLGCCTAANSNQHKPQERSHVKYKLKPAPSNSDTKYVYSEAILHICVCIFKPTKPS